MHSLLFLLITLTYNMRATHESIAHRTAFNINRALAIELVHTATMFYPFLSTLTDLNSSYRVDEALLKSPSPSCTEKPLRSALWKDEVLQYWLLH